MLSKTALHALRAIVALSRLPEGEYCGAAAIAQQVGAPQNYLGKLLQALAQEGLVESQRGLGGGFRLARPAEDIRVLDVVEPIDRVSRWTGCFLGKAVCSSESPCALHHAWTQVRDGYLHMLAGASIADIARNSAPDKQNEPTPGVPSA